MLPPFDRAALRKIQDVVMGAPDLKPHDGITYCNCATQRILADRGCDDIPVRGDKLAAWNMKTIIGWIRLNHRFQKATLEAGVAWAEKGGVALLLKEYEHHGHGASISPEPMQKSLSLSAAAGRDMLVPVVANVGKQNQRELATAAFTCLREDPATNQKAVIPDWAPECFLLVA